MTNQIVIKNITKIHELNTMQHVEEFVWNMPPIPVHQTYTALNNGGIILGAYDDDKMIGFLYSFPGFDGKNHYLCSHMHGILEPYRKDGLGMQMKFKQADIAKSMGYPMITWTFDPLESLNAYLNLHKLKATGAFYKENHYGSMDDGLNQGLPTDRIQIQWHLNNSPTKKVVKYDETKLLLGMNQNHPTITEANMNDISQKKDGWFVAIPANFQILKQDDIKLAKEWRYETRKVFQVLFSHGYQATDLIYDRTNELSYYYFTHTNIKRR